MDACWLGGGRCKKKPPGKLVFVIGGSKHPRSFFWSHPKVLQGHMRTQPSDGSFRLHRVSGYRVSGRHVPESFTVFGAIRTVIQRQCLSECLPPCVLRLRNVERDTARNFTVWTRI